MDQLPNVAISCAERKHITLGAVGLYAGSLQCHAAYLLSVLLPDSVVYNLVTVPE